MSYRVGVVASTIIAQSSLRKLVGEGLKHCQIRWREDPNQPLTEFARDLDAIIVGREKVDGSIIKGTNVRWISKYGVGLDNLAIEELADCGVSILVSSGANAIHVAEHTLGLLLSLTRKIVSGDRGIRKGHWQRDGGSSLYGKRAAVIGCGAVGLEVCKLLQKAFSMDLVIVDIRDRSQFVGQFGIQQWELQQALSWADVASVHVDLNHTSRRLLNANTLRYAKEGMLLINTSRGEVICEDALMANLESGNIGGAALDVFTEEPLPTGSFQRFDNVVLTPHIAASSHEARIAMVQAAIGGLLAAWG